MSNDSTSGEANVLDDVLSELEQAIDGDQTTVGTILSAFQDRSFGALYTLVALIAAMPIIGAIPGVSIITGVILILIASQSLIGRDHIWVPSSIRERSVGSDTLMTGVEKAKPYAQKVDGFIKPRWQFLVAGPVARRTISAIIILLALTMIPLALIPWGIQPPATAIVLFGVALMARDGVFAVLGYGLVVVTGYIMLRYWDTVAGAISWIVPGL
ncbi:MAG: exopolysaccharide biosynthesis protein [Cyanobacteria bacterium J06648_11]